MLRGYPRLGGFGGQRLYRSASHRYKWRHPIANLLEIHLTPLLDAFYASDPPLLTTLTTPRTPPELNPRILTTTDYDELLRPLLPDLLNEILRRAKTFMSDARSPGEIKIPSPFRATTSNKKRGSRDVLVVVSSSFFDCAT
jgi:hypothetical protein